MAKKQSRKGRLGQAGPTGGNGQPAEAKKEEQPAADESVEVNLHNFVPLLIGLIDQGVKQREVITKNQVSLFNSQKRQEVLLQQILERLPPPAEAPKDEAEAE